LLHAFLSGQACPGALYVAVAVFWMWVAEGQKPDRWDLIGGAISLCGMALIAFGPRTR
jgi:small multidrug resistance family-3 protein